MSCTIPDAEPEQNRYTVLHLKQDGKWMMASARDLPEDRAEPSAMLKQLEWLIGDWVDESPDSLITSTYAWTDNRNYILSEFRIQIVGTRGDVRIAADWLGSAGQSHPLLGF